MPHGKSVGDVVYLRFFPNEHVGSGGVLRSRAAELLKYKLIRGTVTSGTDVSISKSELVGGELGALVGIVQEYETPWNSDSINLLRFTQSGRCRLSNG